MESKGKIQTSKSIAKNIPVQEQKPIPSLSKTENFLNNQKYIFGKAEEKKVVSVFMSQKIIQTIVSYLGLINSLIYFVFGGFILLFAFFLFKTSVDIGEQIMAGVFIIVVLHFGVYLLYKGFISIKRAKIKNIREYFFTEKNLGNNILWLFFFLIGGGFIFIKLLDKFGASILFQLFLFLIIFLPFLFFSIKIFDKLVFIYIRFIGFSLFEEKYYYFKEKLSLLLPIISQFKSSIIDTQGNIHIHFNLNFINILIFPFVVILLFPTFIISYLISSFFKYQIFKLQPKGNLLDSFEKIEDRSWKNGFYEITKI